MAERRTSVMAVLVFALVLAFTSPVAAGKPAFPGAVGFGASATGWRGGEIIAVTSLADSGPGSLRACVDKIDTPRVCVFHVSGTIVLDRPLFLRSNVYVAGQTAPGQGIQIRLGKSQVTPVVVKNANDVVVRFLKVRPGPSPEKSPSVDAITLENARRVYLDHLSLMFATDENLNVHVSNSEASDITVANSITAWGLDRANHPKGRHSKGALICSGEGKSVACGRITLWRNLFAHNRDRNPDINATDTGPVEIINNVFYNPISQFGEFRNIYGNTRIVYAGNVALTGPSTIRRRPAAVEAIIVSDRHSLEVQIDDVLTVHRGRCDQNRAFWKVDADRGAIISSLGQSLLSAPRVPAADVQELVLARVGDSLPSGAHRDALDELAVGSVRDCSGEIIDTPAEVGGWPQISPVTQIVDSDGDGFPDSWEQSTSKLDPDRADDPWQIDADHEMPLIEVWLSTLAGDGDLTR